MVNFRRKETWLIGIAAVVLTLIVGRLLWTVVTTPFRTRQKNLTSVSANVRAKEKQLQDLLKAKEKLERWRAQSLPSDPVLAQRLYQNWLLECAQNSHLEDTRLDCGEVRREKNLFYRMPFTIRAQGTLESLTHFLYSFYSRNYLHSIQRIAVTPLKDAKKVDLLITVEAVALDNALAKDQLPTGPLVEANLPDVNEYTKVIAGRNMFAAYSPPPPPRPQATPRSQPTPPPEPTVDPSQFAFVNGIVEVNGRREVWLYSRMEDKTIKLGENDSFEVGGIRGRVVRIGIRDVEIEIDGTTRKLQLGDRLLQEVASAKTG